MNNLLGNYPDPNWNGNIRSVLQTINENFKSLVYDITCLSNKANVDKIECIEGQTIIPLSRSYQRGRNQLLVYLNGIIQLRQENYNEDTETSISFTEPLHQGDIVYVVSLVYRGIPNDATTSIGDSKLVRDSAGSNTVTIRDENDLPLYPKTLASQVITTTGLPIEDMVSKLLENYSQTINEISKGVLRASGILVEDANDYFQGSTVEDILTELYLTKGSGGGSGGERLTINSSTTTITETTSKIYIDFKDYSYLTDILLVYANGIYLTIGDDYTIDNGDSSIMSINPKGWIASPSSPLTFDLLLFRGSVDPTNLTMLVNETHHKLEKLSAEIESSKNKSKISITHNLENYPVVRVMFSKYGYGLGGAGDSPIGRTDGILLDCDVTYIDDSSVDIYVPTSKYPTDGELVKITDTQYSYASSMSEMNIIIDFLLQSRLDWNKHVDSSLETLSNAVGDTTELPTENKSSVVNSIKEVSSNLKDTIQKIDFVNDVKKGDYCYTNNITLLSNITFNTQFYLGGASGVTDMPKGETTAGAFFKCEVVYKASGVPQHIVQTFKKVYANRTYIRTCDNSANSYNWTEWVQLATDDSGWIDLPLLVGSVDGGFTPQYRRIGNEVRLRGRLMGLTGVSIVATLPTGYRPSRDVCFTIPMSGTAYAKGVVLANGSVKIDNPPSDLTSSHHFIIDSISFLNN